MSVLGAGFFGPTEGEKERRLQGEGVEVTTHDIQADEVCPSLKWATATMQRTTREGGGRPAAAPAQQQGAYQPPAQHPAASRPADPIYSDEEPF